MDPFLGWLESTAFSTWMREDPSIFAFPAVLSIHTIGMALIVGVGVALDLRILGVARGVPIGEMKRFFLPMWIGGWLNGVSGVALLAAYPTKALTNPVFYLKLTFIATALILLRSIRRRVFRDEEPHVDPMPAGLRLMAAASVGCWAGAITAGRLLAYTYTRLMAIS
jgi:hypothetical protein